MSEALNYAIQRMRENLGRKLPDTAIIELSEQQRQDLKRLREGIRRQTREKDLRPYNDVIKQVFETGLQSMFEEYGRRAVSRKKIVVAEVRPFTGWKEGHPR